MPGAAGVGREPAEETARAAGRGQLARVAVAAAEADVDRLAAHGDGGRGVARSSVEDRLPVARGGRARGVPALALVVPYELAGRDPVVDVLDVGAVGRYEPRLRVARARRVGERRARRRDLGEGLDGAVGRVAAVGRLPDDE